jgi:hypothetical protein
MENVGRRGSWILRANFKNGRNMKFLLFAIALLVSALLVKEGMGPDFGYSVKSFYTQVIGVLSLWLIGFAVLRLLWLNAKPIAGIVGKFAGKGANHVDTFKDAFKEGKNK